MQVNWSDELNEIFWDLICVIRISKELILDMNLQFFFSFLELNYQLLFQVVVGTLDIFK